MIEIILIVMLGGVFWRYGKEMGSGKWITLFTFLGCYMGLAMTLPIPLIPVIGSAIITGILAMILSTMRDQEKKKKIIEQRERDKIGYACHKCGKKVDRDDNRCMGCGTSLIKR